jgi:hypothetical protein
MKKQLFVLVTILVLLTGCGGGANSKSTRGEPAYWLASNRSIPALMLRLSDSVKACDPGSSCT